MAKLGYKTKQEIYHELEEEKQKLGLSNLEIAIEKTDDFSAITKINGEQHYTISFGEKRDKIVLRHELWHIYQREQNSNDTFFRTISEEWDATSYAIQEGPCHPSS